MADVSAASWVVSMAVMTAVLMAVLMAVLSAGWTVGVMALQMADWLVVERAG